IEQLIAAVAGCLRGLAQPVRLSKFGQQHLAHDSISSATRSRTSCMDTVGTSRAKMRKRKMKNPGEPNVVSQSETVGMYDRHMLGVEPYESVFQMRRTRSSHMPTLIMMASPNTAAMLCRTAPIHNAWGASTLQNSMA